MPWRARRGAPTAAAPLFSRWIESDRMTRGETDFLLLPEEGFRKEGRLAAVLDVLCASLIYCCYCCYCYTVAILSVFYLLSNYFSFFLYSFLYYSSVILFFSLALSSVDAYNFGTRSSLNS